MTYQAVTEGYAAYPPETMRNVPKYLAPIGAADTLIAKPARHRSWPQSTKGARRLMRSDQNPHAITVAAAREFRGRV